jgi:hypothetical protein
MTDPIDEACFRCKADLSAEDSVIYVRAQVGGHWQSAAICRTCWPAWKAEQGSERPTDA